MPYMPLVNNITLLISLSILQGLIIRHWRKGTLLYSISTGVLFGIVAVAGMKSAFVLEPGLLFDGRSIIISIASFLGGPVTALITVVSTGAYRLALGGSGLLMGLGVICESALFGVAYYQLEKKYPKIRSPLSLLLLGVMVHAVMSLMMFLLPGGLTDKALRQVAVPIIVIYPLATMILGLFFTGQEARIYSDRRLEESEENLRQRNAFIETILDNLPIGLAVNDTVTSETLYVNRMFETIYGWPRVNLDNVEHFFECVYPDPEYRREIMTRVMEDIQSGDPERMAWSNVKITTKYGYEKYIDARNIPLPEQQLMISTVQDVTLARMADDKLRQQSELLQSIMDNIPIMVDFIDQNGKIHWVNKAWEKILGYSFEEVQRQDNLIEAICPDPRERRRVKEAIKVADGRWRNFRVTTKSGKVLENQWINIRLSDNTNIGIGIDISDKTRTEKQRKELERQLYQSKKMEAIGRLAGGIAHDFNNMLLVILGNAQLSLARLKPDDPLYPDVREIVRAAERSSTLTRQLLAFSRKQIVSPEVLNINRIISEQKGIIGRLIGEDIEIVLHLEDELWNVRSDPTQIDQILMNLSANARDAITGPGTITIETSNLAIDEQYSANHLHATPGEYVLLSFSDSGCGMDSETRDHIFEPFFTTKELHIGTGLGLATVYGIVNQNGGFINVDSKPGAGTTFRIFLPRCRTKSKGAAQPGEPEIAGGSETILIVEDEEQILMLTRNILAKYGYHILQTDSAERAVSMAEEYEGEIHLLLTDVVMPSMNGKQLQQKIKELKPGIRTLFMSGYTDDVIADRGVLEKGENFIQKPFPLGVLVRTVREVLDE